MANKVIRVVKAEDGSGRIFRICGSFGNIHVYWGSQCLTFGIMTPNDAENWVAKYLAG